MITGLGLATPLGADAAQIWRALLAGHSITTHALVRQSFSPTHPRVTQLALQTAREAIASAHWTPNDLADDTTALIIGTSKGPIESWLTPPPHMANCRYAVGGLHPTGLSQIASTLAHQLHLGLGPRLTISSACATGLHALIHAALLIQSGQYRRVLVVAAESSVHPLFLASFDRLGILAHPGQLCRPFDQHRTGFFMSEASAAICLEAREGEAPAEPRYGAGVSPASSPHLPIPILIHRVALASDATHLTAQSPDGATLRHILRQTINNDPIDLIHAHGTATATNDPIELAALESSLNPNHPPPTLYSHKAALGHSLGASGLISIALNLLAHQTGTVPPNLHTHQPLPTTHVTIPNTPTSRPITRSLALASGFGGPMAAVSLRSC